MSLRNVSQRACSPPSTGPRTHRKRRKVLSTNGNRTMCKGYNISRERRGWTPVMPPNPRTEVPGGVLHVSAVWPQE